MARVRNARPGAWSFRPTPPRLGRFSFSGQGGLGVGVSDLADLTDVGPSFGGGIAYWLTPRVAVRGDFNANLGAGATTLDSDEFQVEGDPVVAAARPAPDQAPRLQIVPLRPGPHRTAGVGPGAKDALCWIS